MQKKSVQDVLEGICVQQSRQESGREVQRVKLALAEMT
jgi:hypothetical protein